MRKTEFVVDNLEAAFTLCREADRPLIVKLRKRPASAPEWATQFKVYPSGWALCAIDGDNPLQTWEE